mgnify:CR=1 FL=1
MDTITALVIDDERKDIQGSLERLRDILRDIGVTFCFRVVESSRGAVEIIQGEEHFDLIFLDVKGVDDDAKVAVPMLHAVNPYIPIIIFSRYAGKTEIVDYIDQGAATYINKDEIMEGGSPLPGLLSEQQKVLVQDVAHKIRNVAKKYQPFKRLLAQPLEVGEIVKSDEVDSSIGDQIDFLMHVSSISEVKDLFPPVPATATWEEGGERYYRMPDYKMTPLRELLVSQTDQHACEEAVKQVLESVLNFVVNTLYKREERKDVPGGLVQVLYFDRYRDRVRKGQQKADAMDALPCSYVDMYKRLLNVSSLEIGKKPRRPANDIMAELENDHVFRARLQPPLCGLIHGDLHFGNILVDVTLPGRPRVKLIDPRGFRHSGYVVGTGDICYDFGKLLQSTHGWFDLIRAGHLLCELPVVASSGREMRMTFKKEEWRDVPLGGGASGARVISRRRMIQPWIWGVVERVSAFILAWIAKSEYARSDKQWRIRTSFNEALHFCTLSALLVEENPKTAFIVHARGIELLNVFYDEYKSGRFDP